MTTQALATQADFANFGFASYGFAGSQLDAELLAASADVADSIAERYTPPFTAWGPNLTRAVCTIAAWNLLCVRGFDSNSPADVSVKARFDFYTAPDKGWLARVNAGEITLNDVREAGGATPEDDIARGGDSSDSGRFADPEIGATVTP
jgi:phage gp36-like protein